jgi:Zn-dependent protease with chaperone function
MQSTATDTLTASYFDGVTAKAQTVTLRLVGGDLVLAGEGINRSIRAADVQWPERTRHGIRVAHFADGGSVQCADAAAWDAWRQQGGQRDSWVVKAQQSWRGVLVSVLLLVVLGAAVYTWGLPWAARAVVAVTPHSADAALGQASLSAIDDSLMQPSKLSIEEQTRLREAFVKALSAQPAGSVPAWQLVFRKSRIGPNAFALPGGTMVMTDEMVELVGGDDKVITAVLAHELGHVRHRHGLRMLVQATVLAGVTSVVLGDFSTLLAGVPLLLGQASYSRDAEKEADAEAVRILKAAGISPEVMVTLFEKLEAKNKPDKEAAPGQSSWLGIAFASHPSDADRIAYFRQAAQEMKAKP